MGDEKRKDYISWDEYFMGVATVSYTHLDVYKRQVQSVKKFVIRRK